MAEEQRAVLAPYEPSLGATEPAALLADAAARTRVFRAMSAVLAGLAGSRPLVVAIDDLQWADDLTAGFVRFASSPGALTGPVGIVATYRTEEVGPSLAQLLASDSTDVVTVDRLDPSAVGEITASMLALAEPPPDLCAYVADRSGGNPFFACELLRAAVEGGRLGRDSDGRWMVADGDYESLDLPRGVRQVVARRLAGLDTATLGLARAAAVLGYEVPLATLEAMAGADALDRLAELERRAVVEPTRRERLRFDHHTIRDTLLDGIADGDRPSLHAAAARAIETTGDVESHLADLGHHHERAGAVDTARAWYARAAESARTRYANADAMGSYRDVLRLAPGDATARNDLGELLQHAGDYDEALATHARAYDDATSCGDAVQKARALREQGWIHQQRAHPDDAAPLMARALDAARDAGDRPGEALCLSHLAALHAKQSRLERARELFSEALDLEIELGHPRACTTRVRLANTSNELGLLDAAEQLFEQALIEARAIGDRASEAMALGNYAILHYDRGALERATELFEGALAIAREIGDRRRETMTLGNLAAVLHDLGKLFDAARAFELGLAGARELGLRRSEAIMLGNYARLEGEAGDIDSAFERFEHSVALLQEIGYPAFEAMTTVYRATLLRRMGQLDEAARDLEHVAGLRAKFAADYHVDITLACERGHHALATGGDPTPYLDAAADGPDGLSHLVDRLREASTCEPSELEWGERAGDIPPGLRRALARRGKSPPVDQTDDTE
jgi:tetratricopeptide (TPR) repeat protein